MSRPRRRSALLLLVLLAVFLPAELVVLPVVTSHPDSWEPGAWVRAHANELPQSVIDIKSFPPDFRKAIIRALPMDAQVQLWRGHLESYLQDEAGLTPVQQDLVQQVISICPRILLRRGEDRPWVRALEEEVLREFSREKAGEIFVSFGPRGTVRQLGEIAALQVTVAGWLRETFGASADTEECGCSAFSDYCQEPNPMEPGMSQCQVSTTCYDSSWGCGFAWWYACDGWCVRTIMQ